MTNQKLINDLADVWVKSRETPSLHILRAHKSSKAVIIRRNPSKCFHIISWNTKNDNFEYGSWFNGKIYSERCDLSWDGQWMVYLAMGSNGETWNGICKPPWLNSIADVPNMGTWAGGGFFSDEKTLKSNDNWCWDRSLSEYENSNLFPFSINKMESGGEVFPIFSYRLERDGWKREGEFGKEVEIDLKHCSLSAVCIDDPGWSWKPTSKHPVLKMYYRGYFVSGYTFEYQLEDSDILDQNVECATWDFKGDLLVVRLGTVARYTLSDIKNKKPSFFIDLKDLENHKNKI